MPRCPVWGAGFRCVLTPGSVGLCVRRLRPVVLTKGPYWCLSCCWAAVSVCPYRRFRKTFLLCDYLNPYSVSISLLLLQNVPRWFLDINLNVFLNDIHEYFYIFACASDNNRYILPNDNYLFTHWSGRRKELTGHLNVYSPMLFVSYPVYLER